MTIALLIVACTAVLADAYITRLGLRVGLVEDNDVRACVAHRWLGRGCWDVGRGADGQRVTAAAGDTIRIIDKVTAAAGYVESTTIGSTIVLVAINATEWVATSVNGVYTDGTFTFDNTSLTTP